MVEAKSRMLGLLELRWLQITNIPITDSNQILRRCLSALELDGKLPACLLLSRRPSKNRERRFGARRLKHTGKVEGAKLEICGLCILENCRLSRKGDDYVTAVGTLLRFRSMFYSLLRFCLGFHVIMFALIPPATAG